VANQAALAIESAELRDRAELTATVAERNRLARELHDSVTQNLYSVTLYAEAAARLLESGSSSQAASYMRDLRDTAQEALREMRLLIFELRPPELEKTGLATALQTRLQSVEARGGMQASLNLEGVENEPRVPLAVQQELYHIAQEALNNTLKHSHASRVVVTLTYGTSGIWLEIADDGAGFDAAGLTGPGAHSISGGMGLGNMRERAARIAARLTIDTAPGRGTRIMVARPNGTGSHS
jgi:signal transduction histidine kinase